MLIAHVILIATTIKINLICLKMNWRFVSAIMYLIQGNAGD